LLYRHGAPYNVAQFGVLKAGKFYASLDSELSAARLALLLKNLGTRLLLCDSQCESLAHDLAREIPALNVLNTETLAIAPNAGRPVANLTPNSIAYIIYTSGSTGAPEGVVISHRQVLRSTLNQTNSIHLRPDDRGSQICPLSSAASTNETFPVLLNGAALFPFAVKTTGISNVSGLARWLRDKRITVFVSVPVLFRLLAASLGKSKHLPDMRMLRLSGDRILAADIDLYKKHFSEHCLLRAGYGASECHLATQYFIDHTFEAIGPTVPAGYAVEGVEVFTVDDDLNRLAPGERGEIAVRSTYMADGYWKNPERTAARFLVDPGDERKKIYLTRDLGYLEDDGCLIHLGRTDSRVKIYGKWVAVTDIEEVLIAVPEIREAVVVARDDGPHGNVLIAYYTTSGADLSPDALRGALSSFPVEIIPKEFVRLDEMPVTRSNKIDRRKLAEAGKKPQA
jgi:amino acid adenylation domain-containing protein